MITWKGSPNYDSNRSTIDRIVIHWFGVGTLDSAYARFQNPASKASAHYGISGNTIYQWVKEEDVAYHAGNYVMNQRSIGIEHDATTDHDASEETYKSSIELVRAICQRYNIPIDRDHILKHNEVSDSPTQCPGTLSIERIVRETALPSNNYEPPANSTNCRNILLDPDYVASVGLSGVREWNPEGLWTTEDLVHEWKKQFEEIGRLNTALTDLTKVKNDLDISYQSQLKTAQENARSLQDTVDTVSKQLESCTKSSKDLVEAHKAFVQRIRIQLQLDKDVPEEEVLVKLSNLDLLSNYRKRQLLLYILFDIRPKREVKK